MKKIYVFLIAASLLQLAAGCAKKAVRADQKTAAFLSVNSLTAPPSTWQEHWFEHNQLLHLVFADTSVAVYFDNDVNASVTWPNTYLAQAWNYTKATYGALGSDSRLWPIFHAGKYSGGHPSTYFDVSHDLRNVIDVGSSDPNAWTSGTGNDIDLTTHE